MRDARRGCRRSRPRGRPGSPWPLRAPNVAGLEALRAGDIHVWYVDLALTVGTMRAARRVPVRGRTCARSSLQVRARRSALCGGAERAANATGRIPRPDASRGSLHVRGARQARARRDSRGVELQPVPLGRRRGGRHGLGPCHRRRRGAAPAAPRSRRPRRTVVRAARTGRARCIAGDGTPGGLLPLLDAEGSLHQGHGAGAGAGARRLRGLARPRTSRPVSSTSTATRAPSPAGRYRICSRRPAMPAPSSWNARFAQCTGASGPPRRPA